MGIIRSLPWFAFVVDILNHFLGPFPFFGSHPHPPGRDQDPFGMAPATLYTQIKRKTKWRSFWQVSLYLSRCLSSQTRTILMTVVMHSYEKRFRDGLSALDFRNHAWHQIHGLLSFSCTALFNWWFHCCISFQPRNIFLHGLRHRKEERPTSFQVKIGDFGLARKEVVVSPGGSSPLASLIEPLTPLFPPGMKIPI